MTGSVFEQVRETMADIFGTAVEDLQADSSPQTIGNWDSMQHLNLVLALEDRFAMEFAPEEIERMVTLDCIVAMVEGKQVQAGATSR